MGSLFRLMRHPAVVGILVASGGAFLSHAQGPGPASPPPAAVKILALFDQLRSAEAAKARGSRQPVAFALSDAEITDYMRYSLRILPRPGLDSLTVKAFQGNYISTFIVLDFDAVERWKPGTIPGVLRPLLKGKKSLLVDYRISANDSKIGFSVEKALYQDTRIPAFIVEKVIATVAARQPEKYDTSKPMPIPFGLRQVWTKDHVIAGQN